MGSNSGMMKDGLISEGASSEVQFGVSSCRYLPSSMSLSAPGSGHGASVGEAGVDNMNTETDSMVSPPAAGVGSGSQYAEQEQEQEMPFLKKWVRTKHAILFRISNRTVQVVFYDRSEVLLSSEAKVITYVSKQGLRTEHSLDQVLANNRLDIAKRLKYTKDIMYRLISTQSK